MSTIQPCKEWDSLWGQREWGQRTSCPVTEARRTDGHLPAVSQTVAARGCAGLHGGWGEVAERPKSQRWSQVGISFLLRSAVTSASSNVHLETEARIWRPCLRRRQQSSPRLDHYTTYERIIPCPRPKHRRAKMKTWNSAKTSFCGVVFQIQCNALFHFPFFVPEPDFRLHKWHLHYILKRT